MQNRHAVRIRLVKSMTWREIAHRFYRGFPLPDRALRLREFNAIGGTGLPDDLDTKLPADAEIWLTPRMQDDTSCAIWIRAMRSGWIIPQVTSIEMIGFLHPTQSHAASDSGSIGVQLMPVPMQLQEMWIELLGKMALTLADADRGCNAGREKERRSVTFEIRRAAHAVVDDFGNAIGLDGGPENLPCTLGVIPHGTSLVPVVERLVDA